MTARKSDKDKTAPDETEDLEALFDQIAAERTKSEPADAPVTKAAAAEAPSAELGEDTRPVPDTFDRIGKLTRNLHDALLQLGYDKTMQKAVSAMPDTRDRLNYIATLTGQAADRTLGALEQAKPIQEQMQKQATNLSTEWERLLAGKMPLEQFKPLVLNTHQFLQAVPDNTERTNSQLLEIMMAQDFHDLTGQVIKKIVELAQGLEQELLKLLLEISPQGTPMQGQFDGNLSGPVIHADGRGDVVTNQAQVDDLLESLGF